MKPITPPCPAPDTAPETRSEQIAADIRSRILAGKLLPGAQLPTWSQMEKDFSVGRATLMRAMSQLRDDGFVTPDSTRGTYVAERLPHLCRYALAFPREPQTPGWNRMWWSLARHAAEWTGRGDRQIECFYGVLGNPASPSHERLMADIRAERLAGVIFAGHTPEISKTIAHWPNLPRVRLGTGEGEEPMPSVYFDWDHFRQKAAQRLSEMSVRSVAMFSTNEPDFDRAAAYLAKVNVQAPPKWRFTLHISTKQTAQQISHLLLDRPADDRPDGLLILDDNLTAPVLAGVVSAGVSCPDQLQVVTHANLPCEEPSVLPVERLGFVTGKLLTKALEYIDALRRGEAVPDRTFLPAVFEKEL